jgi:hypothetical protein
MRAWLVVSVIADWVVASFFFVPLWALLSASGPFGDVLILGVLLLTVTISTFLVRRVRRATLETAEIRRLGLIAAGAGYLLVAVVLVFAAALWKPVVRSEENLALIFRRYDYRAFTCVNNLRQIDAAKEQWAMANSKTNGQAVVISEVNAYIKGNTTPRCPAGGRYTYNAVGVNPVCSMDRGERHENRKDMERLSLLTWRGEYIEGRGRVPGHHRLQ